MENSINLNYKPYKVTYEGSWNRIPFEIEQFRDENWEINWLDGFPDEDYYRKDTIESEIQQFFLENYSNIYLNEKI